MVDLTNPLAYEWMKGIIVDNLITVGRAGGWMHDFGEYTPFDALLWGVEDAVPYHN